MIFKSYLVENNIKILDKKLVLFYGENIGLKNDFKNNYIDNATGTGVWSFTS